MKEMGPGSVYTETETVIYKTEHPCNSHRNTGIWTSILLHKDKTQ